MKEEESCWGKTDMVPRGNGCTICTDKMFFARMMVFLGVGVAVVVWVVRFVALLG